MRTQPTPTQPASTGDPTRATRFDVLRACALGVRNFRFFSFFACLHIISRPVPYPCQEQSNARHAQATYPRHDVLRAQATQTRYDVLHARAAIGP